jgi:hypothetical protein
VLLASRPRSRSFTQRIHSSWSRNLTLVTYTVSKRGCYAARLFTMSHTCFIAAGSGCFQEGSSNILSCVERLAGTHGLYYLQDLLAGLPSVTPINHQ